MTRKYVKPSKSFANGNTIEHTLQAQLSLCRLCHNYEEQFCFQGEEYHTKTIFNATMKY